MSRQPWKAKCQNPKCCADYRQPPPLWDCLHCGAKTWQPDDVTSECAICRNNVAKFSRHHCRMCGFVTCAECTKFSVYIPEWGTEKQRVCRACAMPDAPVEVEGYLNKLGAKGLFGEKFQKRWFELRGQSMMYGIEKGKSFHGAINLEDAKAIDVATHPNGFCIIGPKLKRGYILTADTPEEKLRWVDAIAKVARSRNPNSGGAQPDDDATEDVLFSTHAADGAHRVSMSDYDLLTVLGLGSFGRVMKVREKASGAIFAMKILDKQQVVANKMVTHTQAEKDILGEIDHPFICKLHHAFQTRKHLVLVLDFLCGGELFFHLQRCKRFTESRARFYAAEIGSALEYIHVQDIIYRDLKPENLVLSRDGHVTLTDFGLAKKEVRDMTHTFCGTPEYMAPELIRKHGHSKAVDWWSLGVFLYEMVGGLPPFYSQNVAEMYDMVLHRPLTFPKFFSPELQSLLTRLLERDPARRLQTGDEFRSHPFFRGIDFKALLEKRIAPDFVPDVTSNDLRYFDKQFTQESVSLPALDQPNDPNDPASRRFEGFEFSAGRASPAAEGTPTAAAPAAAPAQRSQKHVVIDPDAL